MPAATAFCTDGPTPVFEELEVLGCDMTLDSINLNVSSLDDGCCCSPCIPKHAIFVYSLFNLVVFPLLLDQVTNALDENHMQRLVSSTQMLTSRSERLTASNISKATEIVSTILSSNFHMTKVLQVNQHFTLLLAMNQ